MKRIAILGLGPTHNDAPTDWEMWGLAWDGWVPQFTRAFEMHPRGSATEPGYLHPDARRRTDYEDYLAAIGIPIYMQEPLEAIPNSRPYPFEEITRTVGDNFRSTLAYPMAMAICEGDIGEISLFGIDMASDEEYAYQRENMQHLCRLAQARGIVVNVNSEKFRIDDPIQATLGSLEMSYPRRYGFT